MDEANNEMIRIIMNIRFQEECIHLGRALREGWPHVDARRVAERYVVVPNIRIFEPSWGNGPVDYDPEPGLPQHACPNCGFMFHTKVEVFHHTQEELEKAGEPDEQMALERFICCNRQFFTMAQLLLHLIRELKAAEIETNSEAFRFQIQRCEEIVPGDHFCLSAEVTLVCSPCCEMFATRELFAEHIREAHTRNPFQSPVKCPYCLPWEVLWDTKKNLVRHMRTKHNGQRGIQCSFCPRKCREKSELEVHLRRRHKARCFKCGKIFLRAATLLAHVESHFNSAGPHGCIRCTDRCQPFQTRVDLLQHYVNSYKFHCYECRQVFENKTSLRIHKRVTHHIEEEEPSGIYYRCPTCFRMYRAEENYMYHLIGCWNINPPCISCGARFKTRTQLLKHILRHNEPSVLRRCKKCDKAFGSRGKLASHMKTKHRKGR